MRAAFAGMVDYAGLFPPAGCSLDEAVRHYAQYRQSADRWMLGRFVVAAAQLEQLVAAAAPVIDHGDPWPLAVTVDIGSSTDLTAVERFDVPGLAIDAIECKVGSMSDVQALEGRAMATPNHYLEVAITAASLDLVEQISASGAMGKIRTGGLIPEAFPAAGDVVRLMATFIGAGVAFKATAGLHHPFSGSYPISYAPDAAQQPMFGFVNLLVAVADLLERGDPARAGEILDERDRSRIVVGARDIVWRNDRYDLELLERAHREAFTAFGSCSFREPYDELGLGVAA